MAKVQPVFDLETEVKRARKKRDDSFETAKRAYTLRLSFIQAEFEKQMMKLNLKYNELNPKVGNDEQSPIA